jgi:methionine-rich copper-binding protein CopC
MRKTKLTALLAIALMPALLAPSTAFAHAHLVKASPAVGSQVATSPIEIRISFSEAIEQRFSGLEVKTASGSAIATGAASLDPNDKATLVVPVKAALAPGSYKVTWHVVSVDTHKTQGTFSFEVKP